MTKLFYNDNTNNLYESLTQLLTTNDFALFHESTSKALHFAKYIEENFSHKRNSELEKTSNQIIIKNSFYDLSEDDFNQIFVKFFVKHSHFKERQNLLNKLIEDIVSKVLKSPKSNTKFIKFWKNIFSIENHQQFLNNYLNNIIVSQKVEDFELKITRFSINLSNAIFNFMLYNTCHVKVIEKCFSLDKNHNIKLSENKYLINFITILFSEHPEDLFPLLKEEKISDLYVQSTFMLFLQDLLIKKVDNNTFYNTELKNIILNSPLYKKNRISLLNTFKTEKLKIGYYFVNLLENSGFFERTTSLTNHALVIKPKANLIDDLILNSTEKPYLTFNQLNKIDLSHDYKKMIEKNNQDFIHENPRISLSISDNSYLHKKTGMTLSINTLYLNNFLQRLISKKTDEMIYSFYNINKNITDYLCSLNPLLATFVKKLLKEGFDFSSYKTALPLIKEFDNNIANLSKIIVILKNKLEHDLSPIMLNSKPINWDDYLIKGQYDTINQALKNITDVLQIHKQYYGNVVELINRICSRKSQLILLINNAIEYSFFKYFIVTTYLDSRGRRYDNASYLSIFLNPNSKMFVSMYDHNLGKTLSLEELRIIKDSLDFPQTKEKVAALIDKGLDFFEAENNKELYLYILSYLKCDISFLTKLIEDDHYFIDNNDNALNVIVNNIKKNKKIYYVHSLIYFEQLRFRNKHHKHLLNYYQKDASTSGYQIMTGVLKDVHMGKIANLIGNENYDIYQKTLREGCYSDFCKLKSFVSSTLDWFNISDFMFNIPSETCLKKQNLDFNDLSSIKKTENFKEYFKYWILLDLHKAIITSDFLINFIEFMETNEFSLNKSNYDLINNCNYEWLLDYLSLNEKDVLKKLQKLVKFQAKPIYNKILEFLFCIRYALTIIITVDKHLKITDQESSIWSDRDFVKINVMTTLYMSTAYGRRESYSKILRETYLLTKNALLELQDFISFLEKSATRFLIKEANTNIFNEFANDICQESITANIPIILINRNLKMTIDPKIVINKQVPCSSFSNVRAPQLVLKYVTNERDYKKLKSMVLANVAHFHDADIMHKYYEKCLNINDKFNTRFILIFGANHDCFLSNIPKLLTIILEDSYLSFLSQNNLKTFKNMSETFYEKYKGMDPEEFLKHLNPINPNFVK